MVYMYIVDVSSNWKANLFNDEKHYATPESPLEMCTNYAVQQHFFGSAAEKVQR